MNISYELLGILLAVIIQGFGVAKALGKLEQKLIDIEKKQDKHNGLIERMVRVEDSTKSAHHRIDRIEGKYE